MRKTLLLFFLLSVSFSGCLGVLRELDRAIDRVEDRIVELKSKESLTPSETAELEKITTERKDLLAKREAERKKLERVGGGIEGLLIMLGTVIGIPLIGAAGKAAKNAIVPPKRE